MRIIKKKINLSVAQVVSLSLFFVLVVSLGAFGTYNYLMQKKVAFEDLDSQGDNVASRLAFNLVAPVWSLAIERGEKIITSEMSNKNIFAVVSREDSGRLFAAKIRNEEWEITNYEDQEIDKDKFLVFEKELVREDKSIGTVSVYFTRKFVNAELQNLLYVTLLSFVVIGLVILFSLFWLIKFLLIKPVGKIKSFVEQVSAGNFDVEPGKGVYLGELSALKKAQLEMKENLRKTIEEVKEKESQAKDSEEEVRQALKEAREAKEQAEKAKQEGFAEAAKNIESVVGKIGLSISDLLSKMEDSAKASDTQKERSGEVATAMEQMNASILEIAKNASSASTGSEDARSKAQTGSKKVDNLIGSIATVNKKASALQKSLTDLGKQADDIGKVIVVINDIADQTNLLALNAAIEAARAGEAGRGFAVVADEVRKLAEKTMKATKEVEDAITNIQQGSHSNEKSMKEAESSIEDSTKLAKESGDLLKEIVVLINKNADEVRGIATASEEQSASSEEIARATDDISQTAVVAADSVSSSYKIIENLSGLSRSLENIVVKMK